MSCLRSYDDLCEALEAYEANPSAPAYVVLRMVAIRCGADMAEPVVAWAKRRRDTYRATVTGAVAHLNAVITSLEAQPPSLVIGQVKG